MMTYFIEGKKFKWEVVLGLEVHAQIKSNSKLFSTASTEWGAEPNSQVELVDCGMPGALPVIEKFGSLGVDLDKNNFFYQKLISD